MLPPKLSTMSIRDIYLTPPAPTCSVRDRERGLSPDFAGVGATLQLRRGLCQVSCIPALARRMGVPAVRRARGLAGSARPLALRPVPIRDVGHRRHHLPGQSPVRDDLIPANFTPQQRDEPHKALGVKAYGRNAHIRDRL